MATIPVVWCTDPNSPDPKPTAFALRGIQLQGDHITAQHMKALKELVNAASEGRLVLPANGSIMFLDCGLNINSEVQVAHGSQLRPVSIGTVNTATSLEAVQSRRSSREMVESIADAPAKDEGVTRSKDSNELSPTCDSCVPYSEYELLYEFLCCAKCMNERLATEEEDKKKRAACDKSIGHNSYARRESQKEPAPYMHFCDKANASAASLANNNNRCEERVIRKYSVEQKALNHGPLGGAQSICRESADSGDRNTSQANPAMKNGGNSCNNCDTRSKTAAEGQQQLRQRLRKMGTPGLVPPTTTTTMMMLNYGQNRSMATDDDRNITTNNDNHSGGGGNRVNARAPSLHNARLGTALAVCGGRRSMNNHHHQLRNKRIDRNCGRISIRRSKRRVECPRAKKVLMTHPQQQQQPEQSQEQRLRPRRRCDVEDHKIVVASAEISKREIERLLYARVNKLMKKKHRKELLQCNKTAELVVVVATDEDHEQDSNEKPPCNTLTNERVDREFITPVIVVDPPTKSNPSSRKTSFDSTCTVNSHDSGFIDILNRIDNGAANLPSPQPGNDPNGAIGQIPDKSVGDHLLTISSYSATRNPSDNNNIVVLDNGEKLPVDNNNKLLANLFIEDPHKTSAELKYAKSGGAAADPELAALAVGATTVVGLGATKIECLTQSKNRRKSYEEFRSMFRDSEPQLGTSTTTTTMAANSNFPLKNHKLSEEHIEEQEEILAEKGEQTEGGGEMKEGSGKQYLLNPDQIHQIKMRRKSYEEFKLMMRDPSNMHRDEETFTRAGSSRFLRKNSNQRRKSSMFAKFATTKEESEQRTTDTVIYDLLPKLHSAKEGREASDRDEKEAGVLVKSAPNLPTKQRNSLNLDSSDSINSNSSLSRLKRKLRESNSNLYEKLITYGTIYDIIQKKNLNYRKYDKYMTYGTIYEILHRKSSITSNQNTYENFNYFSRKKNLSENFNEKGTQHNKPKVRTTTSTSSGKKQQRKSLSELVPYFGANFIVKDGDPVASGDRLSAYTTAPSPVVLAATTSGDGEYRVKSPASCGTIYDMKRAAEVGVKNTRFTVHRIDENVLQSQSSDSALAELAMISKKKQQQEPNPATTNGDDKNSKPVQRRHRRFSNILKLEYGDRLSVGGTVQTLLEIPQRPEKSGTIEEHGEESQNHSNAASSLNLACRPSATTTAVGGSILMSAAAADEGRLALAKAFNDNYAKIKSKAPFNEKSSIFKSNSLDMLSNGAAVCDAAAGSPSSTHLFGECQKRGSCAMGGYPIKKNNSDSSLSTKFTNSDGSTKVSSSIINEAVPLSRPNSVVSSAAIPSKSLTKAHDLKMSSAVGGHPPSPPVVHTNHNMHLNIKKFFGRKNATRRLSEFTRGEFLNEKA